MDMNLLDDVEVLVIESSDVWLGESKEPGMGRERGVEETSGRRDEVLVVLRGGSTEGLTGFLANFPVTGSL